MVTAPHVARKCACRDGAGCVSEMLSMCLLTRFVFEHSNRI
jgi:hypothetical protein